MDDVFSLIFSGVSDVVDVMNQFVISVNGFTFTLWQFEVVCFILALIVPVILVTRSYPVDTSVSERVSVGNDHPIAQFRYDDGEGGVRVEGPDDFVEW